MGQLILARTQNIEFLGLPGMGAVYRKLDSRHATLGHDERAY